MTVADVANADTPEASAVRRKLGGVILIAAAILGIVLGGIGTREAKVARGELRDYVDASALEAQVTAYTTCVLGNLRIRPATRVIGLTLRDLVAASLAGADPAVVPAAFAGAEARLTRAILLLENRDCARAHPEGHAEFLARRA